MEVIRLEDVHKTYSDNGVPVHALRGVRLSIARGEFVVIAGPSGSGKTTLLNVMGALDTPTEGKVYLEGKAISELHRGAISAIRLKKLGFVFQAYNLIPVLTALENIEFSMMLLGIDTAERRRRALAVMAELDIDQLADKRPNEMSGGQQQRVAVARAIVNNPSIILADEPTANLDSETGGNLLDLMERMNRQHNLTFIFSSHDPEVIRRARRLIVLHDGLVYRDESGREMQQGVDGH
ncbi:MAG: ABC transporter ATP-binding protein [Bacteroidia bacterium]|nr:ABC transporter ATP-binding protein [Bacteroidia bacterium]